jgi:hypothetical protein
MLRGRNAASASALIVLVGVFAATPLIIKARQGDANLTAQSKPLSGSQIMRGAYLNTGSRDAGADPDWQGGRYVGKAGLGASFHPSDGELAAVRAALDARKAAARGGA